LLFITKQPKARINPAFARSLLTKFIHSEKGLEVLEAEDRALPAPPPPVPAPFRSRSQVARS
jgi:hypothetical protein